ncbi:MAG: M23 family metallopeptidase [Anaerolineaceae bacterium]
MDSKNDPQSSEEQVPYENPEPQPMGSDAGSFFTRIWDRLFQIGLGDRAIRLGATLFAILVFIVIVVVMGRVYGSVSGGVASELVSEKAQANVTTTNLEVPVFSANFALDQPKGIPREAALHTILPSRGRTELTTYVIQAGDTLFSIAEKFGLKPESILWGNRYTLGDDPHTIFPGQELIILPVDGTLHRWSAGEGLNGVASFYHVTPESIINYPANKLNMATIGDFAAPNIDPGTLLIISGGYSEFPDWRTPRITREDPATAKNVGPGACTEAYDGVMGTLNFTWPTTNHYLSGYDYDPSANHYGIDIDGENGDPITAADNGVIVYAGWNDWGYGEMIVIDHGQGWQTLYAHLSSVNVSCGQEVYRGDLIGTIGSTGNSSGPHLHFELRSDDYGRVNPWDFLQ